MGETQRKIKLFCPSAAKLIQIIALEEHKLDLGSISRAFGLDPKTLKLNGHFISRGIDLVASSITWRSLIGFFSARGLPTGETGSNALVVDGKLSKIGSKRSYGLEDDGNWIVNTKEQCSFRDYKKPRPESCSSSFSEQAEVSNNGLGLKRKLWLLEDESDLKRTKKTDDDGVVSGFEERNRGSSCSEDMKRMRGDEMVAGASPLKKIR